MSFKVSHCYRSPRTLRSYKLHLKSLDDLRDGGFPELAQRVSPRWWNLPNAWDDIPVSNYYRPWKHQDKFEWHRYLYPRGESANLFQFKVLGDLSIPDNSPLQGLLAQSPDDPQIWEVSCDGWQLPRGWFMVDGQNFTLKQVLELTKFDSKSLVSHL